MEHIARRAQILTYGMKPPCAQGKDAASAEALALAAALPAGNEQGMPALTDRALAAETMQTYAIREQVLAASLPQMLRKAGELLGSGQYAAVLLVCHSDDGCAVMQVSAYRAEEPAQAVLSALQETETAVTLSLAEQLLQVILAVQEVSLALNCGDDGAPSLWICDTRREKTVFLQHAALVIQQAAQYCPTPIRSERFLIPLWFHTQTELETKLTQMQKAAAQTSLHVLSQRAMAALPDRKTGSKTIAFLIGDAQQLLAQTAELLQIAAQLMTPQFRWSHASGSFYINCDVESPKIVFMNPPGGMLKEQEFFRLYTKLGGMQSEDGSQYFHLLHNDHDMLNRYLFEVAVTYITMTQLQTLGVEPDYLSGASMGELAFIISDKIVKTKKEGDLTENLKDALKSINGALAAVMQQEVQSAKAYFGRDVVQWSKWYLKCSHEKVQQQVDGYDNVFIVIIGAPEDIIISGEHAACTEIIRKLGCVALPLDDETYVHTPILKQQAAQIRTTILDKQIYVDTKAQHYDVFSTFYRKPLDDSCAMLADDIASVMTEQVNYVDAMHTLYQHHDARIFIDLSTGQLCGAWAKECLRQQSGFEVVSVFAENDAGDALLDLCAKLLSYQVAFDYATFLSRFRFPQPVARMEAENLPQPVPAEVPPVLPAPAEKPEEATACVDYRNAMADCITRQLAHNQRAYELFLTAQNKLYRQALAGCAHTNGGAQAAPIPKKPYLWDREQVVTMTDTSMSAVLGAQYQQVDTYPVRARMPLPPFLFVSRIVSIDAEFGVLRPSSIVAEYDLDADSVFRNGDRLISTLIASEATHIGIFLMGYIGVDAMYNGTLSFRALDSAQTYFSETLFRAGDTLKTVFKIRRFVQNGATTLVFYTAESYNNDELICVSESSGGFFTKTELQSNKGILQNKKLIAKTEGREMLHDCELPEKRFGPQQLAAFYRADYAACFGAEIPVTTLEKYYVPYETKMLDRVTEIDYRGGRYHSGLICGEKDITPDFWPFQVHFKNDPVFPGILMVEGTVQLYMFLLTYAGLLGRFPDTVVTMLPDSCVKTHFRGQVRKENTTIRYETHIKAMTEQDDRVCIIADVDIFANGIQVIQMENFGVQAVKGQKQELPRKEDNHAHFR